jgi:uncharacterized protein YdeI (BOF family)
MKLIAIAAASFLIAAAVIAQTGQTRGQQPRDSFVQPSTWRLCLQKSNEYR